MRGARLLARIAQQEPLKSTIDNNAKDPFWHHYIHKASDAEVEKYVKKAAQTLYHPTSTARMAPLEDGGVVDPYLRVYGIPNLRIVDASVFPTIPSGHTVRVYCCCE